jgi:hypothetical protein
MTHAETVAYAREQLAAATHPDARAMWAFFIDELEFMKIRPPLIAIEVPVTFEPTI